MSEKAEVLLHCLGVQRTEQSLHVATQELTAAEERGRRAGIEDLRAIQQLAEWAVDAVAAEAGRQGGDQLGREAAHAGRINLDRLRERIAALAPRDSASATSDYPGCGDPAHDCRDGVCGAGPAPRDSGKDLTAADPADRFAKDRK